MPITPTINPAIPAQSETFETTSFFDALCWRKAADSFDIR